MNRLHSTTRSCLLAGSAALFALAGAGCDEPASDAVALQSHAYPPGPYRNRPSDLFNVAQSLSHIVVAHADSTQPVTLGESPMWLPIRATKRSREAAQSRALEIARRTGTESFAELARELSDDSSTAPLGGAMGVVRTIHLPYEYLDALWELPEGRISRVFETRAGFHIIRRDPVEAQQLSFAMLVIKHDGATGFWRPDRERARTREQALALAKRIAEQARTTPERFAELVERHDEEFGSNAAGSQGRWSRRDTHLLPTVLHASAELELGQVSDPLETPIGFVVAQRQPLTRPAGLAASIIAIGHTDAPVVFSENTRSEREAAELAQRILQQLIEQPERFDALRAEHCPNPICEPKSWPVGRGVFGLDRLTQALQVGEIASRVEKAPPGFLVVKRESLEDHPLSHDPPSLELPEIKPFTTDDFLSWLPGDQLASGFMLFAATGADALELAGREREEFFELAHNVARELESGDVAGRQRALEINRSELAALLGPERYEKLQDHRRRWLLDIQDWDY